MARPVVGGLQDESEGPLPRENCFPAAEPEEQLVPERLPKGGGKLLQLVAGEVPGRFEAELPAVLGKPVLAAGQGLEPVAAELVE